MEIHTLTVSEVWRSIPGFEGLYEASTHGQIRSERRVIAMRNGGTCVRQGRILSQATKRNGYKQVTLVAADSSRTSGMVHRLILLTFRGKPDELVARHLDGDKSNNMLANLRWGTYSQNNKGDKYQQGTMPLGEKHHGAKLSEGDVINIRKMRAEGFSGAEIAQQYPHLNRSSIYPILSGKTWKHLIK